MPGLGGGEWGASAYQAVQFYKVQNYGNGVMAVRSERAHSPLTAHLEVVEIDFMLRVFYHNRKRRKEKIPLNCFHISLNFQKIPLKNYSIHF